MRYRDLEFGIFLTRDPAGFVDGPNVYTYVRQNPWTFFDPTGLSLKQGYDVIAVGGKILMRNKKFAGKAVTTKMLREGGSVVKQEVFDRIAKKFGDDFAAEYDEAGRLFFPKKAIKDSVRQPFGPGDTEAAWGIYEKKMIKELGEEEGKKASLSARENYEMHHTNEDGLFELVDKDAHQAYAHTGGNALSKQDAITMGVAGTLIPNYVDAMEKEAGGLAIGTALVVDGAVMIEPTGTLGDTVKYSKGAYEACDKHVGDGRVQKVKDLLKELDPQDE